jgi:hypothetical protein
MSRFTITTGGRPLSMRRKPPAYPGAGAPAIGAIVPASVGVTGGPAGGGYPGAGAAAVGAVTAAGAGAVATPGGSAPPPTMLPTTLATMSSPYMYIPLLGRTYDVYVANNGPWSNGSTWSTGVVPTSGQDVLIQAGAAVTIDADATWRMCIVQGSLQILSSATHSIAIDTLSVMDVGTLSIMMLDPAHTATFTFADGTFNTSSPGSRNYDPEMYGRGLLNAGTVRIAGAAKTPFAAVAAGPLAGATTLTIRSALADPTVAPTVSTSTVAPTALQPGTYRHSYTWDNGVGETLGSPEGTPFTVTKVADPTTAPTVTATGGGSTGGLIGAGTLSVRLSAVGSVCGETRASPAATVAVSSGNIPTVVIPAIESGSTGWNVWVMDPSIYHNASGVILSVEALYAANQPAGTLALATKVATITKGWPKDNTTAFAPIISFPAPASPLTVTRVYLSPAGGAAGSGRMYGAAYNGATALVCEVPHGAWAAAGLIAISNAPDTAVRSQLTGSPLPAANATQFTGWRTGDVLLLPETRQIAAANRFPSGTYVPQDETVTITGIAGQVVTFTPALSFDHKGIFDFAGTLRFLPDVANMTRNIIFQSANPAGSRGHTLHTMMADVQCKYASFLNLARTLSSPIASASNASIIDNTMFSNPNDATSAVTHVGTNQIGRYPYHMHHCSGPMMPDPSGYQFQVVGCVVDQGPTYNAINSTPPKWGFDVHASHFGLIRGNITHSTVGGSFTTEDGSEICNTFERNMAVRVQGTGQRQSFDGTDGDHFWARGPMNYWRDNHAYGAHTEGGQYCYGFMMDAENLSLAPVSVPASPGSMSTTSVYFNRQPLNEHARNMAWGGISGATWWWVGADDSPAVYATQRTYVVDIITANQYQKGIYHYQDGSATTLNWQCFGDPTLFFAGEGAVGVFGADYTAYDTVIRGATIECMSDGIEAPHKSGPTWPAGSVFRVENCSFKCSTGIYAGEIGTVGSDASLMPDRRVEVENCLFDVTSSGLTGSTAVYADITSGREGFTSNITRIHEFVVTNFQGNASDHFHLYAPQQAGSHIMEQSGTAGANNIGSPVSGMTNTLNLSTYGVCTGGEIATCGTTRANVTGFVCPT